MLCVPRQWVRNQKIDHLASVYEINQSITSNGKPWLVRSMWVWGLDLDHKMLHFRNISESSEYQTIINRFSWRHLQCGTIVDPVVPSCTDSASLIHRSSIDVNGTDFWRTTTLSPGPVAVSLVHRRAVWCYCQCRFKRIHMLTIHRCTSVLQPHPHQPLYSASFHASSILMYGWAATS